MRRKYSNTCNKIQGIHDMNFCSLCFYFTFPCEIQNGSKQQIFVMIQKSMQTSNGTVNKQAVYAVADPSCKICIGGSRGACPAHVPLRVQILLFQHTKFSKHNCLRSQRPPTRSTPPWEILDPPLICMSKGKNRDGPTLGVGVGPPAVPRDQPILQ